MKRTLFVCCALIHSGIALQSACGDSAEKGAELEMLTVHRIPTSSTFSPKAAFSAKVEELQERSSALIAAISAKIEALIAKSKSSKNKGSGFLKIKCSQAGFNQLVGRNVTVLSVDEFNRKTAQGSSLLRPSWWIPTTGMATNFMTSKNFQQVVGDGYAFALYDRKNETALFYFDWKEAPDELEYPAR